jgi:hypothetical protein
MVLMIFELRRVRSRKRGLRTDRMKISSEHKRQLVVCQGRLQVLISWSLLQRQSG